MDCFFDLLRNWFPVIRVKVWDVKTRDKEIQTTVNRAPQKNLNIIFHEKPGQPVIVKRYNQCI